jgi:cell wall-associated NlpC family hydrolase
MNQSAHRYVLVVLASSLVGACSSHRAGPAGQAESYQFSVALSAETARRVAEIASSLVGSPYRYGGRGPEAFDCSGLVYYSYRSAGLSVPRTSAQQFEAATLITLDQARAGDLLFFRYQRKVSHVGIYLGDRRFVHAPSNGKPVSVASLADAHYRDRFVGAGRIAGSD